MRFDVSIISLVLVLFMFLVVDDKSLVGVWINTDLVAIDSAILRDTEAIIDEDADDKNIIPLIGLLFWFNINWIFPSSNLSFLAYSLYFPR